MVDKLSIITIVNNEKLYSKSRISLERQDDDNYFEFIPVNADKIGWNAAKSLNYGIEKAKSDWVICAHQDVVFPDGWLASFLTELHKLARKKSQLSACRQIMHMSGVTESIRGEESKKTVAYENRRRANI